MPHVLTISTDRRVLLSTPPGATAGPASASGEGNINDNGNSSISSSNSSNNIDQSAVRDSAAGTTEEEGKEEEEVDGDGDGDGEAGKGKGKGKGKGVERRQQEAVAADDCGDPCPICQDDLPEKERGVLKCVSSVVFVRHTGVFLCLHYRAQRWR